MYQFKKTVTGNLCDLKREDYCVDILFRSWKMKFKRIFAILLVWSHIQHNVIT